MATSKPAPASASSARQEKSFWLPFAFAAVFGALVGGTATYLTLLPRLRTAATPAALPADPTQHEPGPEITAGQPPAQAERSLGNFYYDHSNWAQAITHYEAAIKAGSDDADIRTDLGNAYRFMGRTDEALAAYQLAQKMNPAHEFSLFNQGGLYFEQLKQPQKAVEIWNEFLRRFPNGQSAPAARQLIAQAQGIAGPGLVVPNPAGPAPASPGEDLILQRIQSAKTTSGKP